MNQKTTVLTDKKAKGKTILFYCAAFMLPLLLMLLIYGIIGIYPFGESTVLTIDLYHQYVDFLGYFRQLFSGNASIFYSFAKSLGGNMIGLFAYYASSPVNLLLLLFPVEMMGEGVLVLTLIKVGLCGLTFCIMTRKIFSIRPAFTLLFSTAYALISYNLVFAQNIMWLDGVLWLPIIILGLYRLITEERFLLYTFSLAVAMISNYYIGFMLCLFSLLYFVYQLFLTSRNQRFNSKQTFSRCGYFIAASLLAAGIAAALLLPTFLSLQTGKATFELSKFTLQNNFSFSMFLQKFFIGEMDINQLHLGVTTTLPDIFCTTLMFLLGALYFCNKKISYGEKAASGVMLFILFLSFHIKAFDLIWHGFNTPIGFLYRNAFFASFMIIYLACRCFQHLEGIHYGQVLLAVFGYALLGIYVNNYALETLSAADIWLSVGMFFSYGVLLILFKRGRPRKAVVCVLLIGLLCAELITNGYFTLYDSSYVSRKEFCDNVKATKDAASIVKTKDPDSFYRMDKTYYRSKNDGMMHNYPTITHSSSTADYHVVNALTKLGFRNESNIGNGYNYGSTLPANSLLGIKYILSKYDLPYFQKVGSSGNITVYQNPYALPLGFAAQSGIAQINSKQNDILDLQNQIFSSLSGNNQRILTPLTSEVELVNLTKSKQGKLVKYTPTVEGQEAYLEFTLTAENDDSLYAYFPTDPISESTCDIYVNGEHLRTYFDSDYLVYYDIINLGQFTSGQEVTVRVVLQEDRVDFSEALFYALDVDALQSMYARLSLNPWQLEEFSNTHLKGQVTIPDDQSILFTTIPIDAGWTVKVDGEKVNTVTCMDTFIGVEMSPGRHEVEFSYTPPGFTVGLVISLFSVLVFLLLLIVLMRKNKPKQATPRRQIQPVEQPSANTGIDQLIKGDHPDTLD